MARVWAVTFDANSWARLPAALSMSFDLDAASKVAEPIPFTTALAVCPRS